MTMKAAVPCKQPVDRGGAIAHQPRTTLNTCLGRIPSKLFYFLPQHLQLLWWSEISNSIPLSDGCQPFVHHKAIAVEVKETYYGLYGFTVKTSEQCRVRHR